MNENMIRETADRIQEFLKENPHSPEEDIMRALDFPDDQFSLFQSALGNLISKGVVRWEMCYILRKEGKEKEIDDSAAD